MIRKIVVLIGVSIFLSLMIPVQIINAEESIELNVVPGFDGTVKPGSPFPLQLTVNNSGEDFTGEISVKFAPSHYSNGNIVIPINIPKGTEKKWTVYHPGIHPDFSYDYSQETIIQLFEGSLEDGNQVDFEGEDSLSVRVLQDQQSVISVVTNNPDTLNSYRSGQYNFINPHVFQLNEDVFPNNPFSLSMIDLIVLDNAHIDEWSQDQQDALLKYIKLGGSVLVSNSTEQFSHLGILSPYAPFTESTQANGANLQFLSNETSITTELYEGKLIDGSNILVKDQEHIILAYNKVALGNIYQATFQLDAEEVIQTPAYGQWLANQLASGNLISSPYYPGMDIISQNYHMIGDVGELFEKGNLSFPVISTIVIIYVLLLIPIIYLILRKIDKREHSWWIIPVISVVSSIIIFFVGAYDRIGNPSVNELGIYVLDKDHGAVGFSSNSLLSHKQGEFTITYSEPDYSPIAITENFNNDLGRVNENAYLQLETPKKEIRFPRVDFWSTKTSLGPIYKENSGDMTTNLSYENGKLTGTITNQLNVSVKELWFAAGSKMVSLGPVDRNSTITVDESLNTPIVSRPTVSALYNHQNQMNYQGYGYEELSTLKENRLFEFFRNSYLNKLPDQPLLLAISEDPFIVSGVKGGSRRNAMNLFVKPITIDAVLSGDFELTKENMLVKFSSLNQAGQFNKMEVTEHEAYVGIGEYQLTYQIPASIRNTSYELKEATINLYREQGIDVFLYNVTTNEYEQVDLTQSTIKFSAEISQYIDEQGILTFKFVKSNDFGHVIPFPTIVMKGDISHD